MRRLALLLALPLAPATGLAQVGPAPGAATDLRTRAEATGFVETSRYEDVVRFVEDVARRSRELHAVRFGYTYEGRALPLVVWAPGEPGARIRSPEDLAAAFPGRLRVLVFANIHAGEVAGKEAALVLLRELAAGHHRHWAERLVLLVAPIYNADGNERIALDNRPLQLGPIGGMGQRANAQGYDLNRDFVKLDAPESRALVQLLRGADPHVVVDLHTTNGTVHGYHLTYAPPLSPDTPRAVDAYLRETWLPAVTEALAERPGRVPAEEEGRLARLRRDGRWRAWHYGNLPEDEEMDAPRGWYSFDARPRFGTNYVGLRNRFAILSEAYAYLPFDERVAVTLRFVEEILDFAADEADEIRRRTVEADRADLRGRPLTLAAEPAPTGAERILLGAIDTLRHPYTGLPLLKRTADVREERMQTWVAFRPAETDAAPAAYLLPAVLARARDLLEVHGIRTTPLSRERTLEVEAFRIDETAISEHEFEGHRARTLEGAWVAERRSVPAGTVVVPMDQPLARLAFTLLEPRSRDGLTHWNVLDEALEETGGYPILRTRDRSLVGDP